MKKPLLIAFAAVLLYSCSKKNDSPSSSGIVGKWYVTTDSIAEYTNSTLTTHSTAAYNHTAYALFNSDGSGMSVTPDGSSNDTLKYNYIVSGKTLTLSYPTQVIHGETIQGYSDPVTVTILTSSKLETQDSATEVEGGVTYLVFEQTDFAK